LTPSEIIPRKIPRNSSATTATATGSAGPGALLLWLNILGLDAPLVALVWQDFFAWNFGAHLTAFERMVLGLSFWLGYTADRWLDGWKFPTGAAVSPRHQFAQRHRVPLVAVWLLVLAGSIAIACFSLPAYLIERGLLLVGSLGIYLFLYQWPGTTRWLSGLKEIAVAFLFSAGTLIFILPNRFDLAFWWPVTGWCLLCFLDCYAIACWELELDRAAKQESIVTRWPFLARGFKFAASLAILFALAPLLAHSFSVPPRLGLAVAASALILMSLDFFKGSVELSLLRISADLALLTPLLFRFIF
jgi:hypothetical protein